MGESDLTNMDFDKVAEIDVEQLLSTIKVDDETIDGMLVLSLNLNGVEVAVNFATTNNALKFNTATVQIEGHRLISFMNL